MGIWIAIVEEDPTAVCRFQGLPHMREMTTSYSSLLEGSPDRDPYDFSVYMDFSPVTVNSNAPLELVHQIFTKLGARFILVNNLDGYCGSHLAHSGVRSPMLTHIL
jgi:chloride channel 3/4/5